MKSRVHPKYKTKYRVGNWRAYERALVQRGNVTLWLSPDARAAWRPAPSGQPGGQKRFSDLAIKTALTLRLVFRLPLRQAEGFLRSALSMMDVDLRRLITPRFFAGVGLGGFAAHNDRKGLRPSLRPVPKPMAPADLFYLFCTWTPAFYPFWRIRRFEISKSFENSRIAADRLPPPPNSLSSST